MINSITLPGVLHFTSFHISPSMAVARTFSAPCRAVGHIERIALACHALRPAMGFALGHRSILLLKQCREVVSRARERAPDAPAPAGHELPEAADPAAALAALEVEVAPASGESSADGLHGPFHDVRCIEKRPSPRSCRQHSLQARQVAYRQTNLKLNYVPNALARSLRAAARTPWT